MKQVTTLLLLCIATMGIAQIKGNKNIETREFEVSGISSIAIKLSADVVIDGNASEGVSITADSNLFDYMIKSVKNKTLILDQKEWISPSQQVKVVIGAPSLSAISQSTHGKTIVSKLNVPKFSLRAETGTIKLAGKVKQLHIKSELAEIDAGNLLATDADIQITGWGEVIANVANTLNSKVGEEGKLIMVSQPNTIKGDVPKQAGNSKRGDHNQEVKYIDFQIKNNSTNRNHFRVVGPKPEGGKFSYGFPMMPQQKRKERWTTGTKVYKVNNLGMQKLLITIKAADENQTVALFD